MTLLVIVFWPTSRTALSPSRRSGVQSERSPFVQAFQTLRLLALRDPGDRRYFARYRIMRLFPQASVLSMSDWYQIFFLHSEEFEPTLCLNDEEINEDKLDNEPTAIDNIVPPRDGVEGPRIDKLIERHGGHDSEILVKVFNFVQTSEVARKPYHHRETLCTHAERQNL